MMSAILGSKFFRHPSGSSSNSKRHEYISYRSSSSGYSSILAYTTGATGTGACLDFLNAPPGGAIRAYAAGFAISFRRWPGTIWLWMVLLSSSSSSYWMYFGFPDGLFSGCFSNLPILSSNFLITSFLPEISVRSYAQVFSNFSNFLMAVVWSLSTFSFSSSLPCSFPTMSFRDSSPATQSLSLFLTVAS
jgi:hypothetical protein